MSGAARWPAACARPPLTRARRSPPLPAASLSAATVCELENVAVPPPAAGKGAGDGADRATAVLPSLSGMTLHAYEPELLRPVPEEPDCGADDVLWLNPDDAPGLLWDEGMKVGPSVDPRAAQLMEEAFASSLTQEEQTVGAARRQRARARPRTTHAPPSDTPRSWCSRA